MKPMTRHERIEDWAYRTSDIAWCHIVEIKDDGELVAALEQLRQDAVKLQQMAYNRLYPHQTPNKVAK